MVKILPELVSKPACLDARRFEIASLQGVDRVDATIEQGFDREIGDCGGVEATAQGAIEIDI